MRVDNHVMFRLKHVTGSQGAQIEASGWSLMFLTRSQGFLSTSEIT